MPKPWVFTSRAAAESYSEFRWTWWEGDVCLLLISLDLVGRGRLSTFLPYLPIFVVNKSIYWFYCFSCCFNGWRTKLEQQISTTSRLIVTSWNLYVCTSMTSCLLLEGQYNATFLLNNLLSFKESLTRGSFPFRCAAGHC